MTRTTTALLLFLLPACTETAGSPAGEDPGTPTAPHAAGCESDETPERAQVLACGFGPAGIELIAAEAGRLYAVTSTGTYVAVDTESRDAVKLWRDTFSNSLDGYRTQVTVHDDQLYRAGVFHTEDGVSAGLQRFDGTLPTDEPTLLALGFEYEPAGHVITDGTRLYFASTTHVDFAASRGPVIAGDLAGQGFTAVTPDDGQPFAVDGDALYYLHDRSAKRVGLSGGVASTLVDDIPQDLAPAYGDGYVYTTRAAAPYDIVRVPATGGAAELVATADAGNPEAPIGPPTGLVVNAGQLYFAQSSGDHSGLYRVPTAGGESEWLFSGLRLSAPRIDGDSIYVAFTRGGTDTPLEGVIARLVLP